MGTDRHDERKGNIVVKKHARKKGPRAVGASELAQMGVCERLVVFEHRFGKRNTERQRIAIERGLKAHDRFYRDGALAASDKKGRCFIATLIFGPSHETAVLRMFRDRVLRRHATGRWLIGTYYRAAPRLCVALERYPWLQPAFRIMLKPMVWLAERALRVDWEHHAT
jgi:hypothetical protein